MSLAEVKDIKEDIDKLGVPIRYTYSLPDAETLHRLIDYPNREVPPYLFAVLLDLGGKKEIAFGDATRHYEIVKAIEREKGIKIDKGDWRQLQIDFEKGSARFNKIMSVGYLRENDVCLLLRSICSQLFVPSRISIIAAATSFRYIYDPISGELQKVELGVEGEEIKSLGKVQPFAQPVLA